MSAGGGLCAVSVLAMIGESWDIYRRRTPIAILSEISVTHGIDDIVLKEM